MRPKLRRVLFQVAVTFVLLIGFMMLMTAINGRRSPWATGVVVAILVIVRGAYMWRRTPPNSPAKLVKEGVAGSRPELPPRRAVPSRQEGTSRQVQ